MTATRDLESALARIDGWDVDHASAVVFGSNGTIAAHGDISLAHGWASVTKLVTTVSVLVAADRRLLDIDEPAGPAGATIRHLLAHASGLPFEGQAILAAPGSRRIYSNTGFDLLGALVAERAGAGFDAVIAEWILERLGMTATVLVERPSDGLRGPVADLALFGRELLRPTLLSAQGMATATTVAFPGLVGVVPGVGRFDPCDWGLGFEIHGAKIPHWMGRRNSPAAFGHFGGSGAFLWIDPVADIGLAVLTDRTFGPWALEAWPPLSDEVLLAAGQ